MSLNIINELHGDLLLLEGGPEGYIRKDGDRKKLDLVLVRTKVVVNKTEEIFILLKFIY